MFNFLNHESRRTPGSKAWLNCADNIESYLEEDGHQTWGFVIYRCTYESDDDWQEFLKRYRFQAQKTMEFYNGMDIMEKFDTTVFDDKELFDDASTAVIRDHFIRWTATAAQREQGTGPSLSQRYRYCIQIDKEALKWILDEEADALQSYGFVNLIKSDWTPADPSGHDPIDDPVEDCNLYDVGWMMVELTNVVGIYYYLRDREAWYTEYRRPPKVAHS